MEFIQEFIQQKGGELIEEGFGSFKFNQVKGGNFALALPNQVPLPVAGEPTLRSLRANKNLDSIIDYGQFMEQVRMMFKNADEDCDGVLSLEEYMLFQEACDEVMGFYDDKPHEGDPEVLFAKYDANKDGKLSWDEIWVTFEPMAPKLNK